MRKKTLLWALLAVFIIAEIIVGSDLVSVIVDKKDPTTIKKTIDTEAEDNQNETQLYIDEESLNSEEVLESGDTIDLIDDTNVSCIKGNPDNLYEATDIDEYNGNMEEQDYYNKSNYGNYFTKLMTCSSEDLAEETSFALKQEYSVLKFTIGLWDCSNEDTATVIVYKGMSDNEKEICRAKRSPGQSEKEFTVNVADCDVISIKLVGLESGANLVTNGFKVTKK